MAQETRKGKRAPAALRVRFRAGTVEEFIEQQSPNISSGGMFIKSKSPLARGTLMVFDFQLQDGSPLIKGVGRVVWARKPESAGNEPPGMGIKFIRVEPESLPTFQQIMAGKRPSDEPKDVVVRLGETDKDGAATPAPAAKDKPEAGPKAAAAPKATASAKPAASPSPSTASSKPGTTKAAESPAVTAPAAKSAAKAPKAKPAVKAPEAKPVSKGPTKPASKEVLRPKPPAKKEPAEKKPLVSDLRATPKFEEIPHDLLKDAKPPGKDEAPAQEPISDDVETPIPTGDEDLEKRPELEAKPAVEQSTTEPALSRPIKVLQGEGEPLGKPSEPRELAGASGAEKPSERAEGGSPIAGIFDSSKPAAATAEAAKPTTKAQAGPDASPKPAERPVVTAAPTEEPPEERRSATGLIVGIIIAVVVIGGGITAYLYMSGQLGGGVASPTPEQPEQPIPGQDAGASTQPEIIATADAAAGGGESADAAVTAAEAGAPAADAAPQVEPGPAKRILVIDSDPTRSPVTFNQRPIGRTPQTITSDDVALDRSFTVVITRRGHENWSETIEPDDPRWGPAGAEQRLELSATLVRREREEPVHHHRRDSGEQTTSRDAGTGHGGGDSSTTRPPPSSGQGETTTPPSTSPPTTPPPPEPGDVEENPY